MKRQNERPHFSDTILDLSERFQHHVGHSALGSTLVRTFVGSTSPAYRQLDWRSQKVEADMRCTAEVSGDPNAGRLARNWHKAAILVTNQEELTRLKDTHASTGYSEAVAYISDKAVHVGTKAIEGALFKDLNDIEAAVAMRMNRKPVEVAMGLWLPSERTFVSTNNIVVENQGVYVSSMTQDYPGIHLV